MIPNFRNVRKKACAVKRKVTSALMCFKPAYALYRNRRAVSAVISNLILIGAVIVVGMAALAFARSNSSNYQTQYQQTVSSDIDKLKEGLSFEYVFYNSSSKNLYVYFLNSGNINFNVPTLLVNGSSYSFSMYYKNGQADPQKFVDVRQEAYIVSNAGNLAGGFYTVRLTTERGSSFEFSFAV